MYDVDSIRNYPDDRCDLIWQQVYRVRICIVLYLLLYHGHIIESYEVLS